MGYVIRRPPRVPSAHVAEAPPVAPRVEVPKVVRAPFTPEQIARARAREIHAEVVGEFRKLGRVDNGDPITSARDEYRCEDA